MTVSNRLDHWMGVRKGGEGDHILANYRDYFVSLTPKDQARHSIVLGSTGSGKSTFLLNLIAQNILLRHAFIVFDLRGDFVSAILELCAGHVEPERIALFDLREKEKPLGFDPFKGAGETYFRALGFLAAIEAESSNWGPQLAEYFRNAALLFASTGQKLPSLERLFYDADFRNEILSNCSDEQIVQFWLRYGSLSR